MTLRIEKMADGPTTTIRLIGRIRAELLGELKAQIQGIRTMVVLDLEEVSLVDVDAVRFLGECQAEGAGLVHCSPYINDWIATERGKKSGGPMSQTIEETNKALVIEAFDKLFNKRDYAATERYWSPGYIQHSAHIAPGRDGLFDLIKGSPATLKYEPGLIVAERDYVIVHGRYSGIGQPANWIVADIVRITDGLLVEHWDVIEDEATQEQSRSGRPMFSNTFPA